MNRVLVATVSLLLDLGLLYDERWWIRSHAVGSTCLLPDRHAGSNPWTPDDAITVTFAESGEEQPRS